MTVGLCRLDKAISCDDLNSSRLVRGPPIFDHETAHVEKTENPGVWAELGRSGEGLEDGGINKPIMTHLTEKYRSGCGGNASFTFNAC
jgi:hypothetical protein